MDNQKIFKFVNWSLFVMWLLAVGFLFTVIFYGCSSSRKVAEESHVTILSDSCILDVTMAYKEKLTEHSEKAASLVADSVVIVYPLRMSPESADPPDVKVYPAYAASLYGVKLNVSNTGSSSLLSSASASKSESSSSFVSESDSSRAEAEKVEEKESSCLWGIVFFMFFVLAGVMTLRYWSK